MESQTNYKIGDKVFIIRDNDILEKEIKAITTQEDKTIYMFQKNSCGGFKEGDIYKTKELALKEFSRLLSLADFKVGEIVLITQFTHHKKINEYDIKGIDFIKEIRLGNDNRIEYLVYNNYYLNDVYGDDSTRLLDEDDIQKLNVEPLIEMFQVGDSIKKLKTLENEYNNEVKILNEEVTKLEKYIGRKFVQRHNKLNGIFGRVLHKKLFGDLEK